MPVRNADIAGVFDDIADLLEIGGENPFRVRAYRNAARTVRDLRLDLAAEVRAGRALPKLPGIGEDLDAKIHEIAATGSCALREDLRRRFPPAIAALLKVPGLGPKRVKALHDALAIDTLPALLDAAEKGRLRELAGFGEKLERRVADALRSRPGALGRVPLAAAAKDAQPLAAYLARAPGARRVEIAGSYRRGKATVGDLDLVVAAADGAPVTAWFVRYPGVREVLAQGPTRSSVVLQSGLQADLRVVPSASFGAALHYFTGSKAHNIAVRRLAQARGLKLNEYGVFRGARRIAGATEESVFAAVGLPWIPPAQREDPAEVAAAASRLTAVKERRPRRA